MMMDLQMSFKRLEKYLVKDNMDKELMRLLDSVASDMDALEDNVEALEEALREKRLERYGGNYV